PDGRAAGRGGRRGAGRVPHRLRADRRVPGRGDVRGVGQEDRRPALSAPAAAGTETGRAERRGDRGRPAAAEGGCGRDHRSGRGVEGFGGDGKAVCDDVLRGRTFPHRGGGGLEPATWNGQIACQTWFG